MYLSDHTNMLMKVIKILWFWGVFSFFSACGGPPTGGRLERRAASGGPLRGGLRAKKNRG